MTDPRIAKKQQEIRNRLQESFIRKKRASDFCHLFEAACRSKYPGLPVVWLAKHNGPIGVLLRTYSPRQIMFLIREAFENASKYFPEGVSFEAFYNHHAAIAQELAARRKAALEQIKRQSYGSQE
jgi:hypothetical protein